MLGEGGGGVGEGWVVEGIPGAGPRGPIGPGGARWAAQWGGRGGAPATPRILIFQKQVTLFTKSGDTLELE